jgi:hypothetical protein
MKNNKLNNLINVIAERDRVRCIDLFRVNINNFFFDMSKKY